METMTKERLEAYRNNKTEILSLDYILNNRWQSETMLGNDVILDYSKGYPMPQSIVGFDQEKYERLQERDLKRKERLEKECEEVEHYVEGIKDAIKDIVSQKKSIKVQLRENLVNSKGQFERIFQ